jgi:hypothetical protein
MQTKSPIPAPLLVNARVKGSYVEINCLFCSVNLEYIQPPTPEFTLKCGNCSQTFNIKPPQKRKKLRKIGTDQNPIDTSFYDILGLQCDCTQGNASFAFFFVRRITQYVSWRQTRSRKRIGRWQSSIIPIKT